VRLISYYPVLTVIVDRIWPSNLANDLLSGSSPAAFRNRYRSQVQRSKGTLTSTIGFLIYSKGLHRKSLESIGSQRQRLGDLDIDNENQLPADER
jgi:hypothetical protein